MDNNLMNFIDDLNDKKFLRDVKVPVLDAE